LAPCSPNETVKIVATRLPSTHENSRQPKSITRSTMKSSSQSWMRSNTGDVTVKARSIRYRYFPTTRTSSTSQLPKYPTTGNYDGRKNSPASISKSSSAPVPKTANQMLYPGVRSTALRMGGVRTSPSPQSFIPRTSQAESLRLAQEPPTFAPEANSAASQQRNGTKN
jgi:hypothetical protein